LSSIEFKPFDVNSFEGEGLRVDEELSPVQKGFVCVLGEF